MPKLSFSVSDDLQEELERLLSTTAREVIAEIAKRETQAKDYMNLKETAAYLGISTMTLYKYINDYDLPVIAIAGKKFISKETLRGWLKTKEK